MSLLPILVQHNRLNADLNNIPINEKNNIRTRFLEDITSMSNKTHLHLAPLLLNDSSQLLMLVELLLFSCHELFMEFSLFYFGFVSLRKFATL